MGMFVSAETWRMELPDGDWLELRALTYPERQACVQKAVAVPTDGSSEMSPELLQIVLSNGADQDDIMLEVQLEGYDVVKLVMTALVDWSAEEPITPERVGALSDLRSAAKEVLRRSLPPPQTKKPALSVRSSGKATSRNGSETSPSVTAGAAGRKT